MRGMKERRKGGKRDSVEGEDLFATARREVWEETGVNCTATSVICFRQTHRFRWPECSDIYFVCLMHPDSGKDETPLPSPLETADCRWFQRAELDSVSEQEFTPFARHVLRVSDLYKCSGVGGIKLSEVKSLNRTLNVYSVS